MSLQPPFARRLFGQELSRGRGAEPLQALLFEALTLAMRAKSGGLEMRDVSALQARCAASLPEGHRLRAALRSFAKATVPTIAPAQRAKAGDDLLHVVDALTVPSVDTSRSDVYG